MDIPTGLANFVIDPLLKHVILDGDKMVNASFGPGTQHIIFQIFQINFKLSELDVYRSLFGLFIFCLLFDCFDQKEERRLWLTYKIWLTK